MMLKLKGSRIMLICGVLLILLSLGTSSTVFASCQTCNTETAECVWGNNLICMRTIELEFDETGRLVSRRVICTSEGPCDWGAPEY